MAQPKTTPTSSIKESWQRIEHWLGEHAPAQARSLAKGATADQLRKLEAQLGVRLPEDFKESCLIHDGQKEECDLIPDGFGTYYLLRLKEIPKEWNLWNQLNDAGEFKDQAAEPDPGVADAWWQRGWMPFASNGGGDHFCLDFAPAKGGKVGQVIKMQHDDARRELVAPSFAAWLGQLADALERGELNDFLE
jgi:cell wall assembly regulator SMI1